MLIGNSCIQVAGGRTEHDVDSGGSDKIGDTMQARGDTVCGG